ncbi:hemicentin-2 isoform X1 [Etheostoma spectabile]|uniref:hemicentin-2 isoform X1 n=1 Tax=Etheostoma spectabile TaxID=54343 RepID=UPI0013AF4A05|nr:hemicentin-2-like isoform X1 [Etheostoma spectabile]
MLPLRMLGFLMLMLSLCDADNLCPTDLNPLTLDPPEVIYGYEESVVVNCISTEDNHAGMYWTVGNTDHPVEYDNSSIQVSLSNWNVKAECKINLTGTYECSKDLKITVYKNPEMVRVFSARSVPIEEETPFELQCDIKNVAPVQNLTVRWYKNNQAIREDSFPNPTKTPVNESSTFVVNIRREENGAKFRCEAQLDFGPHGPQPVTSDTYIVALHYAPELKSKTEDVYVDEADIVTLNCDAEGHPPPHFHWTCDGLNILENTNNLSITVITSTACNCTATNYLGRINRQIHVHVIPKGCPIVVTPAEMVVRFGDPASVNCSTDADVQQIGWEAPVGATSSSDPAVTWKVEKLEDWQITPLCFINLKNNNQCSKKLTITLYKTPDIVSVSALDDGPMVEGTEYHLNCDIINVAPVQKLKVTWYRGNETVHTDVFNETSKVPVDVSSTLRVTPVGDHNGAPFICKAELQLGQNGPETDTTVTSSPYMAVVHYKPVLKACPGHYGGVEHEFSMDKLPCLADGNPPPIVMWYFDGDLINASEPLNRTQSGNYTAEIYNSLGRSTTSIVITVEYGPLFSCKHHYKVKENENGRILCEPEGIPKPTITWNKDGHEIDSLQRWTKHDSGNYSLFATNKHGTANHVLHLEVLYVPVFKEGTYKKEVNLGENVIIDCSAEGNPVPEILWTSSPAVNMKNITWGRQKLIHITGATSTHAGVYSCDAINEVGRVTKSVTLTIKDKTKEVSSTSKWWLVVFIAILILILLIFILIWVHKQCKKHGQYSFVPDKTNEGSDIPMTPSNGVHA